MTLRGLRTAIVMAGTAVLAATAAPALAQSRAAPAGDFPRATAKPGQALSMVFMPKFLSTDKIGRLFDQAHAGAEQAARELRNPVKLQYAGPHLGSGGPSQIEVVTDATARGVKAIMLSNNSGADIVPAAKAAHDRGVTMVTWDFPIASGDGEDVYVAHIDVAQGGPVLAGMARSILPHGGKLAVLSNSPDAPAPAAWVKGFEAALRQPLYAGLEQVDVVYGDDDDQRSYRQALALLDTHRDLALIVAATSNSVLAAARAVRDRKLCGTVKVTGFGIPSDMRDYVLNGCAPQIALWSFTDLGYLAYYTAYLLASGAMKAEDGQQFTAGRLGSYTITKDPMRANGLRVLLGPWTVFDKSTIVAAAK
jgi:rhamnose transport system substrate-binding protein